jgi:hypothetical protein
MNFFKNQKKNFFNSARRALDQSNGAMFLNRKLIVQLSTSRFRPQPKEINTSPKQLMIMNTSSYHQPLKQQQSNPLPSQYTYTEFNYDLMPSNDPRQQSSPISDNQNIFRSSSPLAQDMNNYYSNVPSIDRMTPSPLKVNHMKSNKTFKTGNSNRMDLFQLKNGSIPMMSYLLDTFANKSWQ